MHGRPQDYVPASWLPSHLNQRHGCWEFVGLFGWLKPSWIGVARSIKTNHHESLRVGLSFTCHQYMWDFWSVQQILVVSVAHIAGEFCCDANSTLIEQFPHINYARTLQLWGITIWYVVSPYTLTSKKTRDCPCAGLRLPIGIFLQASPTNKLALGGCILKKGDSFYMYICEQK